MKKGWQPDGNFIGLPSSKIIARKGKVKPKKQPQSLLDHYRDGHNTFREDCEFCVRGLMRDKPARRDSSSKRKDEYNTACLDLIDCTDPDVNGYRYVLTCILKDTSYPAVRLLSNKRAATTTAVQNGHLRSQRSYKHLLHKEGHAASPPFLALHVSLAWLE